MPLPKIATPTHELVLPSTGKTVKYRPFLVKEEKIPYETVEKYRQEGDTRIYTKLIED